MKIQSSNVWLRGSSHTKVQQKTLSERAEKNLNNGVATTSSSTFEYEYESKTEESNMTLMDGSSKTDKPELEFYMPEKKKADQEVQEATDNNGNPEKDAITRMMNEMNERIAKSREHLNEYIDWMKESQKAVMELLQRMFGRYDEDFPPRDYSVLSDGSTKPQALSLSGLNTPTQGVDYFKVSNFKPTTSNIPLSTPGSRLVAYAYKNETFEKSTETVKFSAQGIVKTADGREISLSLDFHSHTQREFYSSTLVAGVEERMLDPLVFNIDNAPKGLSSIKIDFDLDADGVMDNISFAGEGSGFLHLDKNGDGKVNDGSELFGTKSGDGFKDLKQYDKDNNGWIDENDAVFSKLKIWTLDDTGSPTLINLKEAGVGAIYLERVKTDMSLYDEDDAKRGRMRASGIYLKENGTAGMVHQVDLVK